MPSRGRRAGIECFCDRPVRTFEWLIDAADQRYGLRPPGHHAEPEQSMGFCFYNNVAVAAAYLKTVYKTKGIRKILILDW